MRCVHTRRNVIAAVLGLALVVSSILPFGFVVVFICLFIWLCAALIRRDRHYFE